jgi:hypothetical protein
MEYQKNVGREKLWDWFGLSYASWLTLPRVLMHEIPNEWRKSKTPYVKF